jgi:hypothetical protein
MTDIRKAGPPLGLQSVSDEMAAEQRCAIGVANITLLLDLEWRSNLLLGAELSRMKWSGDFTRDTVWAADDKARGWPDWLKRRDFRLNGADTSMDYKTANTLIMWSVLYGCFAEENDRRIAAGRLPLPLPTSVSQLRPYSTIMRRVDDWESPALTRQYSADRMEPPYAADQSEVISAWEAAWETIPPDKRERKGPDGKPVLAPPTESVSKQYMREREGLKQLQRREQLELEEARKEALTVNQPVATTKATEKAAKAPEPKVRRQPPAPKKSEAEIEAERRAYQLQQDARQYRLKLSNLQQSAESLRAFLKSVLAREGTEAYLTELRAQEMGIYSVGKDIELLRDAVKVLQEAFRLATDPYIPPAPITRGDGFASEEVIDI